MYIKVTKNSRGQGYYHLVESYRDQGKVRQRTLLSLGKVGGDKLDKLATAINRHKAILNVMDVAKSIDISDTYILGPLLIVEHLFSACGINTFIDKMIQQHPKLKFNLRRILFTLVVCRFIKPGSKLKIYEYWQEKLYPELLSGKDELHQIYRALDILCQHKDELEEGLFWFKRDLLAPEVDVVLYDLTTLRFESTREDIGELRRFGYSKEMRTDCTQVVLGLLVDTEGIPLGFEVYPGNTFEGTTLTGIVQRLREKFQIRRFIFVADRGLFSDKNLASIRQGCGTHADKSGEFIVGMKLATFKKRHDEFYDRDNFTSINDKLAVYETTHKGDRCIITWSHARAERDRKAREDILKKINTKLNSKTLNPKIFISNSNYRKYLTGLDTGTPTFNQVAIDEMAKRDGFFGVITNVSTMEATEVVSAYKNLWVVEDAFGEIKGNLKARPVFHWTDDRIVGHLTMCFMAYFCEAKMTQLLRKEGKKLESLAIEKNHIKPRPLTVVEAMRELTEVRAIPVKMKGKTVWIRTDIKGNSANLFKVLGMRIPPKLLKVVA